MVLSNSASTQEEVGKLKSDLIQFEKNKTVLNQVVQNFDTNFSKILVKFLGITFQENLKILKEDSFEKISKSKDDFSQKTDDLKILIKELLEIDQKILAFESYNSLIKSYISTLDYRKLEFLNNLLKSNLDII